MGNLSHPILSRIVRNNSRETATSANWKITCREWRTTGWKAQMPKPTRTGLINTWRGLRRGGATAPYRGFGRAGWLSPPSAAIYEMASNNLSQNGFWHKLQVAVKCRGVSRLPAKRLAVSPTSPLLVVWAHDQEGRYARHRQIGARPRRPCRFPLPLHQPLPHQPSTTNHQPSTNNDEPSAINHSAIHAPLFCETKPICLTQ